MSATADVKAYIDEMKPEPGEAAELFAKRMFAMQIEIYSANAGTDLDSGENGLRWNNIDQETRNSWIAKAKRKGAL